MNYEDDIRIDETALDVEWLEQATLMIKYAKHAAVMRQRLDLAKELLDLVRAELDKEIRSNPERFDIDKITETVVQNTIIQQDRFKKANENLINTKFETDIAQSAVRAMDARKDALENLVRLHGQQYFAGPKVPHNITELREQRQREADQIVGQRLTRRRT